MLVPLAVKGVGKLVGGLDGKLANAPGKAVEGVTSKLGTTVSGAIEDELDQSGGPGGMLKEGFKSAMPFGGGSGGGKGGMPGVGKGRRMPVQQSVDIAVPIETVYNQWTQFEQWPEFMHRVTRVTQEDDCTVSFATKIWAKTKEFTAQIETQRPDERIKWRVTNGITHTGVVTFHELAPRLTRVEVGLDVQPGGMLEKAARGMRHIKRASRADLHRFKALIEMQEQETGAWRGVIEEGEVVEEHDSGYDRSRDYTDLGEAGSDNGSEEKQKSGGRRQQSSSRGRGRSGSSSRGRGASAQRERTFALDGAVRRVRRWVLRTLGRRRRHRVRRQGPAVAAHRGREATTRAPARPGGATQMPVDMQRVILAGVQAALEESKIERQHKRHLPAGRALLFGAGLVTAARLATSARGRGMLGSLQSGVSRLQDQFLDDGEYDEPEDEEDLDEDEEGLEEEPEDEDGTSRSRPSVRYTGEHVFAHVR